MARSYDISTQSNKPVPPAQPAAGVAIGGTVPGTSSSDFNDAGVVGSILTAGTQDGVSVSYDAGTRSASFFNTNKGTAAVAAHVADSDPHGDRTYATAQDSAHVAATDPHGDRAAAAAALSGHVAATDPHGDRAFATSEVAAHAAASDPHGDRTYASGLLTTHVAAVDPHGDRAAAAADLAAHTAAPDPHTQYVKVADLSELVDDRVAALLVAGTNVGLSYNDASNTLTITATGGGGGGVTAHSALTGLGADDHPQYVLATGARAMAALTVTGAATAASFTGPLAGNAATATALQAPQSFSITGGATASPVSFNGSAGVALNVTAVDAAALTGTVAAGRLTGSYAVDISGNAATATKLVTPRTINGVAFDGTANITLPASPGANLIPGANVSGGVYNGSTGTTWNVVADAAFVTNTIVKRDSAGDFAAGNITGTNFNASVGAGAAGGLFLQTAGTKRWFVGKNANVEGGLDSGSAFVIQAYSDSGALLSTPVTIARDTGALTASGGITANLTGNVTGDLAGNVTGALLGNATTATRFQTARAINGVAFNGTADITVSDATKLPLAGGALTGAVTSTSTMRVSGATQGSLGVRRGSGSGATANVSLNDLVIDGDNPAGISILTPAASTGYLAFGSPTSSVRCTMEYNHSTDMYRMRVAGVLDVLTATSTGVQVMDASTVGGIKIGYRGRPRLTTTTITAASSGKCHATSGATITIPSGTMSAGDEIQICNNSNTGAINVSQGSGLTMWWCGMNTSGSRTLGIRGLCTIWFDSPTVCFIRGDGLT